MLDMLTKMVMALSWQVRTIAMIAFVWLFILVLSTQGLF